MQVSRIFLFAFSTLLIFLSDFAYAHKPSDSYLSVKSESGKLKGRWDIALRDLDYAIGLDVDNNGELTWGEIRAKRNDINAYAKSRLAFFSNQQACDFSFREQMLDQHSDGTYIVLAFELDCVAKESLKIDYSLLFDVDPQHKGLLKITNAEGQVSTSIFTPEKSSQVLRLSSSSSIRQLVDYMKHGMTHIWLGFDHVLFLLTLLLPSVLVRTTIALVPMENGREVLVDVVKIVTAFTLAHSLTLSLAALKVVSLPTRWVESIIAFSIIVAALNNIFPFFHGRRWLLAFVFGLVHGFGFASVLSDLGLVNSSLLLSLIGFNLGVEFGQILIVVLFLPCAFFIRKKMFYKKYVLNAGSYFITVLASVWLAERLFDLVIF